MLIPKLRVLEIDFVLDVSALGVRFVAKILKKLRISVNQPWKIVVKL